MLSRRFTNTLLGFENLPQNLPNYGVNRFTSCFCAIIILFLSKKPQFFTKLREKRLQHGASRFSTGDRFVPCWFIYPCSYSSVIYIRTYLLMVKVTTNKTKIKFGRTQAGLDQCCLEKPLILFHKVKRTGFCDRNAKGIEFCHKMNENIILKSIIYIYIYLYIYIYFLGKQGIKAQGKKLLFFRVGGYFG